MSRLFSIKTRWCNIRILAEIAMISLILAAGSTIANPSPAILQIGGIEQTSGIRDSCWKEEDQKYPMIWSDTFSINTPSEPLRTRSPFIAHLRLSTINPAEKAAGFELVLVITILLAIYASRWKRG